MIPYYVFGIIYGVGLVVLGLFFLLNVHYLKRYKVYDFAGRINTILTAGVILLILVITTILISPIHWMDTISLWSNL